MNTDKSYDLFKKKYGEPGSKPIPKGAYYDLLDQAIDNDSLKRKLIRKRYNEGKPIPKHIVDLESAITMVKNDIYSLYFEESVIDEEEKDICLNMVSEATDIDELDYIVDIINESMI